jgi:hypothetical protein
MTKKEADTLRQIQIDARLPKWRPDFDFDPDPTSSRPCRPVPTDVLLDWTKSPPPKPAPIEEWTDGFDNFGIKNN